MHRSAIITTTEQYMQQRLDAEINGRDWWHVWRVWQNAKTIANTEPTADLFTIELAALLHDLAHWQLSNEGEHQGPAEVHEVLAPLGVSKKTIAHIQQIIRDTKFKGAGIKPHLFSLEAKIIHDADKLDSLGAIGIAKTFTYGGASGRVIHNPTTPHGHHMSLEEYKSSDTTSINHFYEKNLLLKDRMYTSKGKELAEKRHDFLEKYLKEFYAEWQGRT